MIDVLTYSDLFCDEGDKEYLDLCTIIVDQLSYENSKLGIKSW